MADVKFCKNCGFKLDGAPFCPNCGEKTGNEERKKYCVNCGAQMNYSEDVCPMCGQNAVTGANMNASTPNVVINNNVNNFVDAVPGKECNKWIAFLLCFFLGGLGIHKFYEGKIGMGILYIFTCGLFGIGWLIDLIRIVMKPNPYYIY